MVRRRQVHLDGNTPDSGCTCETTPELDFVGGYPVEPTCAVHEETRTVRAVGGVLVDVEKNEDEPVTLRGRCRQCGQSGHHYTECQNHGTVHGMYAGGRRW